MSKQEKCFYIVAADGTVLCEDDSFRADGEFRKYKAPCAAGKKAQKLQECPYVANCFKPFRVMDSDGNEYHRTTKEAIRK